LAAILDGLPNFIQKKITALMSGIIHARLKAKKKQRQQADNNFQSRRYIMESTINATEERIQAEAITRKTQTSKAEVCFGVLMAVAAIAGMWGVVSLIISYFLG
jgi:Flp pilus assembly protein TadB